MKPVLFLKNITIEGPGTIISFLDQYYIPYEIVDLSKSIMVENDISSYGAVIVLGGPMNVYEEDRYPYLQYEKQLIKKCLDQHIPFLGLCLGSQLLAVCAGASVRKNEHLEIGWMDVNLTEEGKNDPLFKNLPSPMTVFQWHGDTFEIPEGSPLLATSSLCRNQAFRLGNSAYGLQFHPELTVDDIVQWGREYLPLMTNSEEIHIVQSLMDNPQPTIAAAAEKMAQTIYFNFFSTLAAYPI